MLEQCSQLLADMPPACVELVSSKQDDISASLDIAVFFKTPYFGLTLPHGLVAGLAAKGIGLEITGYPVASDAEIAE